MLKTVEAVRFVKHLESGRNRPFVLEVERANGDVVEVVAKLGTAECGYGGLVREAFSSMLAADLSLPVSEPFVVSISAEFVETVAPVLQARFAGVTSCFGCKYVGEGMRAFLAKEAIPSGLKGDAGLTFGFDAGILNTDRLLTKANCLTNGMSLLLIDHELALNVHGRGLLVQDPWKTGALTPMGSGSTTHFFHPRLKSEAVDMKPLLQKLAAVKAERIQQYCDAIPSDWDRDGLIPGIADYLRDLVLNTDGLDAQLKAVLL